MSAVATVTCEAANLIGWYVGAAGATLAGVALLLRILLAPELGPSRQGTEDSLDKWRRRLHRVGWLVPIAWLAGGVSLDGAFPICYARGVAISAVIVFGVLLAVTIVTAANQVARRSVR